MLPLGYTSCFSIHQFISVLKVVHFFCDMFYNPVHNECQERKFWVMKEIVIVPLMCWKLSVQSDF
jgi:hypothetical protein